MFTVREVSERVNGGGDIERHCRRRRRRDDVWRLGPIWARERTLMMPHAEKQLERAEREREEREFIMRQTTLPSRGDRNFEGKQENSRGLVGLLHTRPSSPTAASTAGAVQWRKPSTMTW